MDEAMKKTNRRPSTTLAQQGFTLVETMIAMAVLTVGLLGVLSVFGVAINSTQNTKFGQIARAKAMETVESIYTARQTNQIGYAAIQNTPAGIFTSGMGPLTDPGLDGIDGTTDDVPAAPINVPGPSGVLTGSSPPDVQISLANFQRQIQIVTDPTNGNLRMITVTIQYPGVGGIQRSYTVNALISAFR
jgi:prepilin-type N-terminal cleavage/methylation domain-containing protein